MQLQHKHLLNLLQSHDYKIDTFSLKLTKELFFKKERTEPFQIYKDLGGIQDEIPVFEKVWHLIEPDTVIILDDYLHFNRYRSITLRSDFYDKITSFPLEHYRRYCRNFEKECIKSGLQKGVWDNKESDYYFGTSSTPGDFYKNGSGGWKMRAFQDFLEDIAAYVLNYKLIRFSVYDNFLAEGKLVRLDSILDRAAHPLHSQLYQYISRRIKDR